MSSYITERCSARDVTVNFMKNVQSKVGRRIRDIRLSQGIPQGQLADMAHMTKSYMSEIEAGKKNLTLRSAAKIADCLGVPLEELFRGI